MIFVLILFGLCLGINIRFYPLIAIFIALITLLYIIYRFRKISLFFLVSICIGVGISFIQFDFNQKAYKGIVSEVKENYFIFSSKFEKLYVYEKETKKEIGDILTIDGYKEKLNFYKLESGFDFKDHLNKKGIIYELKIKNVKINFSNPIRLKSFFRYFLNKLEIENASFVKTFLFSSGYEGEINKTLDLLQVNRLMSTSGIYLHFIYKLINKLLSFIPLKKDKIRLFSFGLLIGYGILFFPKFCVIKFILMELISIINKFKFQNKIPYLNRLSLCALIFILIDYHYVYSDSFILGFSIPLVVYFIRNSFKHKKKIYQSILLSFSIYIFFIPFTLKYSSSVNLFAFPLQIILTPLFLFTYLINLLSLIGIPIYFFSNQLFDFLRVILTFLKHFSLEIYAPSFSNLHAFIYYVLYFIFFYYYQIKFKPFYKNILSLNLVLFTLYVIPINNAITQEVIFINVGQGDSCLIRDKNNTVLVDTGGSIYNNIANDTLIPFFKKNRIYHLDYVITTHDDFDHNGALIPLINNFPVKRVITSKTSFPLKIGDINIFNLNQNYYEDTNDSSLVLYFNFMKQKFLLMGDASKKVENEIINNYPTLDCDIIKIGHHGSNTSSDKNFLETVTPNEAIISVGRNYYGHPNIDVLNTLRELDIKIKRTDELGSISYKNYIFM